MYILLLVITSAVFLVDTSALGLPTPEPECGPNEILTDCYNNCQITCKNRVMGYKEYCSDDCSQTGCVCLPAHYRHDNGTCVPQEQCSPPQCNEGEVYNPCGTSRMETCQERGNTCESKPLHCVQGCFCPEGSFLDSNGICVPEEKCPPRTCSGPNEYFDVCPRRPEQTCADIGLEIPEEAPCCEPQCRCIEGYYKDTLGYCIPAEECINDIVGFASEWFQDENST